MEVKQQYLKIKWIIVLIVLILGLLLSISINVVSAAKIQTPNVDQGESVWFDLNVNTLGVVGIDAWTDGQGDEIRLDLYDPTGEEVAKYIARTVGEASSSKASLTYNSNTTGVYKVRVYLVTTDKGQARTVSASSNYPLGLIQSATFTPTLSSTPTPTTTAIPTPTKSGLGSIIVTSFPSGAKVYIEGIYKGITPIKLTDLPQGSPTVKFMLEGYKDWQQIIDIASGKTSYIPVALEPSTIQSSRLTPEDEVKLLEKFKKEINNFSRQDKENLVNIHFQDANKNLANGNYEAAKTYSLLAKAISEDLKDQNLVEKADMLIEVVNTKIENKESTKLIYELLLALGAALIFGYIFGDTFEKKMKKKVHKYLIIAVAFLILFFIFYTLGRLL